MGAKSHLMCDLETLGTVPGCVGLSIGIVEFFPHACTLGKEYYRVINVDSSLEHFLREDPDTVAWWEKQSAEARVIVDQARAGEGVDLPDAMHDLNQWLASINTKSNILFYGNGADFDNPILRCMYDAALVPPYVAGYGGRCYRTLKNLDELLGDAFKFDKVQRQGTYHNALDDAKSQAVHLMENIRRIKETINA
jgi:exodeoxyribonuclease VIII